MSASKQNKSGRAGASRRGFIKGMSAVAAGVMGAPMILKAADLPVTGPGSVQGSGNHKYEWMHEWIKVPDSVKLGDCHGVQESADGRLFIHHNGTPSMLVTDPDGKVITTWGEEYKGGAHGLQLRKEGNEEFLYLALTGQHRVVKTDLNGKVVQEWKYPKEANVYQEGKDAKSGKVKPAEASYVPTNIAFGSNGDFYVADGYGLSYIHRYNLKGDYVSSWGGKGSEPGKMSCCHGIWTDTRGGGEKLAVADRENHRIQYFDMDGKHLSFVAGNGDDNDMLRRPCHFHEQKGDLLIPDLRGRLTILDKNNTPVAQLFDNTDPKFRANHGVAKEQRADGQFICPHGAIWDSKGNIIVVEWVIGGRITKLRRLA